MVMLATSVTAAAGMLPVLPDTPMAGADMASLLAILAETCMAATVCIQQPEEHLNASTHVSPASPAPLQGVGGRIAVRAGSF